MRPYLASGKNLWCKFTSRAAALIKAIAWSKNGFKDKEWRLRGKHPYLGAHRYGRMTSKVPPVIASLKDLKNQQ